MKKKLILFIVAIALLISSCGTYKSLCLAYSPNIYRTDTNK